MNCETVMYAVSTPGPHARTVMCDDLGSARDLAELLTGAAVVVSRDSGDTWEEADR